jgi:single-stranded DNA-specific DHH superfamily exonuclease
MLTSKQITFIREELALSKNPLFLFDDDPDGLCSFLILYKLHKEGHGIIVKMLPKITAFFMRKVHEYNPDKIFILDMPIVEQDFINQAKRPIFWIDHHQPLERQKVHYFNPRLTKPDIYIPTTRMAYQISQAQEDLWLAMVGCLADYHLPDFKLEFIKKYPDLMKKTSDIEQAVFDEPIGRLIRIFSFLLKGKTSDVNKCIKIFTRIKSPYEILNRETPQGKFIYKRFEKINQKYLPLLEKARKIKPKGELIIFTYTEQSWSFTSELAGELLHLHPDKVVIVARKKSGEMKCSFRSKKIPISIILEKALIGIEGYGGGHEFACGGNIKEHDWQQLLTNFEREIDYV